MPVTLQHIADNLAVSAATVSRSLRNDPLIPARTRDRVQATAVEMGYMGRSRPIRQRSSKRGENTSQRSETSSRDMLGLLFPAASLDQLVNQKQDLNFVQIMHGVMSEAEHLGKLVTVQAITPHRQAYLRENTAEIPVMVRERACQALIVRGAFHPDDIAFLADQLPVITVGRIYRGAPADAVVPDSVAGVEMLVAHLVELGHRKLAWIGGDHQAYEATFTRERQAGFLTGCLGQGLELDQQRLLGPELFERGKLISPEPLLDAVRQGATAIMCASDALAGHVIETLEAQEVRVPVDVSVTGFDAVPVPEGSRQVTSIDPCFAEIGRAAVRLSVQRAKRSDCRPSVLTVRSELFFGDTTSVPRDEGAEPV